MLQNCDIMITKPKWADSTLCLTYLFFCRRNPDLQSFIFDTIEKKQNLETKSKTLNSLFTKTKASDIKQLNQLLNSIDMEISYLSRFASQSLDYLVTSKHHKNKKAERLEEAKKHASNVLKMNESIGNLELLSMKLQGISVDGDKVIREKIKLLNHKVEFEASRNDLQSKVVDRGINADKLCKSLFA